MRIYDYLQQLNENKKTYIAHMNIYDKIYMWR